MVQRTDFAGGKGDDSTVEQFERLIESAIAVRASDIHLEPREDRLAVRFRVDGVLVGQPPLAPEMSRTLISRAKILSGMDISERRIPQDGTFARPSGAQTVNIRCSTFPTSYGEKIVLRLLADSMILTELAQLGVPNDQLKVLMRASSSAAGLILVSGPTGSGKTSTLHSILRRMDGERLNIVTLEDPIEIRNSKLNQAQINPRVGFTFASGLRSILRQDPDVILVGEMRDLETAQIAFRASLTGHLVLTTLHTSSTVDSLTRLLDIGLEPFLVASSLTVVMAQRLVRVLCPRCREPYEPGPEVTEALGFAMPPLEREIYREKGCPDCSYTGYRGRTGVFEVVEVDDEMRQLIKRKSASDAYKQLLANRGIPTIRRDGIRKVLAGITTVEEVLRVT